MRTILFILLLSPLFTYGQIRIDKAGDGWDLKIDSAITLIKQTDTSYYNALVKHCNHVEIWKENFSSNYWSDSLGGTIYISVDAIKLNSINNLACTLVHETCHLRQRKNNAILEEEDEERICYIYEFYFARKLLDLEPWILSHILRMLK